MNFDFGIAGKGIVSGAFLKRNIDTFRQACRYISELPYGRNKTKEDALIVFDDLCGTCSTKHALLKRLAMEHNRDELKLQLVIFKMCTGNMPRVANTLKAHHLTFLPEAHNYLKAGNEIIDCTFPDSDFGFQEFILSEREINPDQISGFKTTFHQDYLKRWIKSEKLPFSWSELWQIREACIASLSHPSDGQHTGHFQ